MYSLEQQSPAFLAPSTGFMEDSFSMDQGRGDGSGGNASDGERQMKLRLLARHHLLLCSMAPNRPWMVSVHGLGVGEPLL